MTSAAAEIDRALSRPVLVFGSLPPAGRDLDLLARASEVTELERLLPAAGFVAVGDAWVRWTDGGPQVVDVRPEAAWSLPPAELAALFDEARPVEGFSRLVQPSPAHALLVLARRVAAGRGELDEKRRARLDRALADDPGAWEQAAQRAPAWGAVQALSVLQQAARGVPVPVAARVAARSERQVTAGRPAALARAAAWRSAARRPPRGRVIAISGLDGAGKSSQAAHLAAALDQLGHPAVTQWTRLSYDPALAAIGKPVKAVLRRLAGRSSTRPASAPLDVDPSRVATPEQRIRQSSPTMTSAWAMVVAVSNGRAQRRATRAHLRSGRIVVCDRWTLDSSVHLRYRYGETRSFARQVAVIRLLSPRPLRTFFLDVPADVAYARKDDHYGVEQLRRQQRLYAEESGRAGAHRLDGERPVADLSREIALAVLPAVRARRSGPVAALRRRSGTGGSG